jgi:hypothetical protein
MVKVECMMMVSVDEMIKGYCSTAERREWLLAILQNIRRIFLKNPCVRAYQKTQNEYIQYVQYTKGFTTN